MSVRCLPQHLSTAHISTEFWQAEARRARHGRQVSQEGPAAGVTGEVTAATAGAPEVRLEGREPGRKVPTSVSLALVCADSNGDYAHIRSCAQAIDRAHLR